jgi:hypothetical protein
MNKLTQHIEQRNKRIEEVQARVFNPNRWDFANANGAMSPESCRKEADYAMRDCEKVAQEVYEIAYQKGVDDTKRRDMTEHWAIILIALVLIWVAYLI